MGNIVSCSGQPTGQTQTTCVVCCLEAIYQEAANRGLLSRGIDIEYSSTNDMDTAPGMLLLGCIQHASVSSSSYFRFLAGKGPERALFEFV